MPLSFDEKPLIISQAEVLPKRKTHLSFSVLVFEKNVGGLERSVMNHLKRLIIHDSRDFLALPIQANIQKDDHR